jgi:hypothetical protein
MYLLATITLAVVPLHAYATFPALLLFSKRILEVVFCVVFSTAWITSVLYRCRSVVFSVGETEKIRVPGEDIHVVFRQILW